MDITILKTTKGLSFHPLKEHVRLSLGIGLNKGEPHMCTIEVCYVVNDLRELLFLTRRRGICL